MLLNARGRATLVLIAALSSMGFAYVYVWEPTWLMEWVQWSGFLLGAIFLVVIRKLYRQQTLLEQLVQEQTTALRKSEEKRYNIHESIQDVYFEIALDGTILEISPRIKELSKDQYAAEDLIGRKFMAFLSEPEELVESIWQHLKKHGSISDWEVRYKNRDGSITTCAVSATLEPKTNENDAKIVGTLYDITDRKRAEQRIQTLSRAVEQSPVSIVITNSSGNIEYVNRKFETVSGYTQAEALGQNPRVLKSGHQSDELYQELWKTIAAGHEWHGELCNKRKNGEVYWESASISPIRDSWGQVINYLAIKEDITDRKQIEEELQRRTEEAQAANQAKSQFLANISHEVRTPLNGVIGMIGLLLDTELSATQHRYAEAARASGEILLGLLNNILDFSRIEADRLELEILDFDLRVTLEDIVETLAPRAHEKSLKFTCQIAPNVHPFLQGDPGRLRQVLMALGNNAIKFTTQGEVLIRIHLVSETDRQLKIRFELQDTGIGIPQDRLELLFRSFQQVDGSNTRQFGGAGLGLALAKRLVEKMGGEISATSVAGQGSLFWFTSTFKKLPRYSYHQEPSTVNLHSVRTLVVDDKVSNRLILTEQLAIWNLRYEAIGSARQALISLRKAHAAGDPFRLLITDMQIPDMDGAALGAAIKADPRLRNTILIMLTSIGQRGDVKKLQDIGFAAYLTKPARPEQIYNCLLKVMNYTSSVGQPQASIVTRHTLREARCQQLHILVVEDNDISQLVTLKILEKLGYRADAVASGQEALKALRTLHYDLVLMDVEMPDMDGLEATRQIRSGQAGAADPQIPIIAMTAHTTREEQDRCLEIGMDDHISKPASLKTLSQILARWHPARPGEPIATPAIDDQMADDRWPEIPGLDTRLGLLRIGGDQRLYRRLLERFVETQTETTTTLRQAIADSDLASAQRLAHTVKGVAGNLGASELEVAAKTLEQAISSDDQLSEIEDGLAAFEKALIRLLDRLRNLLNLNSDPAPLPAFAERLEIPMASAALLAALDELVPHLKTRKPKHCTVALQSIEALSWPAPLQVEVEQLAQLVRKYRFREASTLLESLQQRLQSAEGNR
ncbi:MAG: PAS domain S-box protein [Gammaproteobacteria bacterium]|nr:PAS domain S-box protein [Gammaproteobacteria bacterium]